MWPLSWQQLAIAPEKAGVEWLFLGDAAGNLLITRSDALAWKPFRARLPTVAPSPQAMAAGPVTPAPTSVESWPVNATPTPCLSPLGSAFASQADWARALVGCPVSGEQRGAWAMQPFERGRMFWREEGRVIFVLFEDGHWQEWPDAWSEVQPVSDVALVAPPGRLQPVRGFGKLWRE